jgi:hypothetical protein
MHVPIEYRELFEEFSKTVKESGRKLYEVQAELMRFYLEIYHLETQQDFIQEDS